MAKAKRNLTIKRCLNYMLYLLTGVEFFMLRVMLIGIQPRKRIFEIVQHNRQEFTDSLKRIAELCIIDSCNDIDLRQTYNNLDTWRFQVARAVYGVRKMLDRKWKELKEVARVRRIERLRAYVTRVCPSINTGHSFIIDFIYLNGGFVNYA